MALGLAALVVLAAACTHSDGKPLLLPTTTTRPVPPSTVTPSTLTPGTGSATGAGTTHLTVPFTADQDALVVTAGAAPSGIDLARAEALAAALPGGLYGSPPVVAGPAVHGRVSIGAGLGVPASHAQPGWVIPVTTHAIFGCPLMMNPPSIPAWASRLVAIIVEGPRPDQLILYQGVGSGPCQPLTQVRVSTAAELSETQGT